ncbi:MAG TPA: site-specific integrase [Devosiaceae bacterium]
MTRALTAAAVEKIRPDPAKRVERPDGLLAGLYLVVQPSGRKSWAVRYRHHGKPRKMTLGSYPAFDLAKARDEARAVLQRAQSGEDPAGQKQVQKRQVGHETEVEIRRFENVARTFLSRHAKPNNRSWKETARHLGLVPDKERTKAVGDAKADDPGTFIVVRGSLADRWGDRPISEITRAEIVGALDEIVDRGSPVMANRVLATLRKLFNWSISRDLTGSNPCSGVSAATTEVARDRVLADDELRALWQACEEIGWPFGSATQLLILTGQRRSEVTAMHWREIDQAAKLWTLPRERVKTGKAHDVPLCDQALSILATLPRIDGRDLVFSTNGRTPISGWSKAKEALDAKMLAALKDAAAERNEDREAVTLPPWRIHDIRRTVASNMARLGVNLPVIEKILNHTSGSFGGIVGVYQRHEFSEEKRRALAAWGSFVETLVTEEPAGNVILIKGAHH